MGKITKNLKAPRHSVYKLFSVCKREVPGWLAALLASPVAPGALKIKTYDRSGQAVHPSIAQYRGKTYLACTPYPYGTEWYENPCLYVYEPQHGQYRPLPGQFPTVRAERMGSEHYSDPCLFCRDDTLILLFRKCERRQTGKADQLYTISSTNGSDWSSPRLFAESDGDQLISPAAGNEGKDLFCVEYDGAANSKLVRYDFSDTTVLGEKTICAVQGLDPAFFIWHIDVAYQEDGTVQGLFMLRKKCAEIVSKLVLFTLAPESNTWRYERDLPLTEEERQKILFIYKSAFMERSDRILCSACDKKSRYFLFEKQL